MAKKRRLLRDQAATQGANYWWATRYYLLGRQRSKWMIMLATVLFTFIGQPLSLYGGLQSVDYEAFFADRDRGQAMFRVRSATQLGFIASIRGLHLDRTLPRPTACKLDKL